MDVKALQSALDYANGAPDKIALVVLKDAVERFLRAPTSNPAPKKEPGNQMSTEESRRIFDMLRNIQTIKKTGCPACGAPDGVPHYCPGPRTNTGIEYWMNQPRAGTSEPRTVLLCGSGDDLTSRGMGDGQRAGSFGISLGSAKGTGR